MCVLSISELNHQNNVFDVGAEAKNISRRIQIILVAMDSEEILLKTTRFSLSNVLLGFVMRVQSIG